MNYNYLFHANGKKYDIVAESMITAKRMLISNHNVGINQVTLVEVKSIKSNIR